MEGINQPGDSDNIIPQRNRHLEDDKPPPAISLYCQSIGIVRVNPKFPNFKSLESRLGSYANWPEQHPHRPNELAEAGFYFQGVSDSTQCFHCGGALRNWDPADDPWVEHAVWFQKCAFLLLEKGSDFIATVQAMSKEMEDETIKYADVIQRIREEIVPPTPLKAIEEFCKLNEQQQRDMKCRVCSERDVGVISLPCSHFISCKDCSESLTSCPQCASEIDKTLKAYVF